jgi:hypothetical protein
VLGHQPPAADITHHDTLAELQTEHITRVDPGIDAAEHLQGVTGREPKASERPRRGEHRVTPNQLIGRNDHAASSVLAGSRAGGPRCRRTARAPGRVSC